MIPGEILAGLLDPHHSYIERIVEDGRDALQGDWSAAPVAQPTFVHMICKLHERELSRAIQFKGLLNERCHNRIGQLELCCSLVGITDGSAEGIESLLQPPIDSLLSLFPKVSAVMGCDDCLNIGR